MSDAPIEIIVVADHAFINGGQAKVAIESALGLAARGHKVTYFAAVGPIDPRLESAGIDVICLGQDDISTAGASLKFLAQTMWNRPAAERLRSLLKTLDPNRSIVHVHAWAKALSPSIGPVLLAAGVPLVYTMHEFFLVCPTGGFYDYQRAEICHREPMSLACITCNCDARTYPRKVLRMGRHLLAGRGLVQAIRHVITISDLQYETVRPYLPGRIFHHVGNPIAVEDLGPKPVPGSDFLFVGRLSTEKGIAHFCEAARRAGIIPVIAGEGPLGAELALKYPEARMLGWQSPEAVRRLMREARALVFPSVWYEGQPLTVYEALALGTPVIVSDVCAGREGVTDGEDGLWFRSADADSLAAAMRKLSDDVTAARMSAAAHANYWRAPLTLDRHIDAIEGVYAEVMAEAARDEAA